MSKMKTHKATAKRFKISSKGKVKQRKGGQNHFNAAESGNTTRKKRLDIDTTKTLTKTIKKLIS